MQTTPNIATPYPETFDLADVPANMRSIALSWENAFGGPWANWTPVVTQGTSGVPLPLTLDLSTSICRVKVMGKTVYVQARIDVTSGTGVSAYPIIQLPYVYVNQYCPVGFVSSKIGSGIFTTMARNYGYSGATAFFDNHGIIMAYDQPTARIAADWFELLLRYETA